MLFPVPEGPTMAIISPCWAEKSISSRGVISCAPEQKVFRSLSTRSMGLRLGGRSEICLAGAYTRIRLRLHRLLFLAHFRCRTRPSICPCFPVVLRSSTPEPYLIGFSLIPVTSLNGSRCLPLFGRALTAFSFYHADRRRTNRSCNPSQQSPKFFAPPDLSVPQDFSAPAPCTSLTIYLFAGSRWWRFQSRAPWPSMAGLFEAKNFDR